MPAGIIWENNFLNSVFCGTSGPAVPNVLYFGLSATGPYGFTGMMSVVEPGMTGTGYARVGYGNTTTNWSAAATGAKYNNLPVIFPKSTATWGGTGAPMVSVFICDVAYPTSGTVLWWADLDPIIPVDDKVTVTFQTGTILLSLENANVVP
jgi:hypothetical protein